MELEASDFENDNNKYFANLAAEIRSRSCVTEFQQLLEEVNDIEFRAIRGAEVETRIEILLEEVCKLAAEG